MAQPPESEPAAEYIEEPLDEEFSLPEGSMSFGADLESPLANLQALLQKSSAKEVTVPRGKKRLPKESVIVPQVHILDELFGTPEEVIVTTDQEIADGREMALIASRRASLSEMEARLLAVKPKFVIDEVYGGANELLSNDDFELPVVDEAEVQAAELEKVKNGYRSLGKDYITLRLRRKPIGKKLIDQSARLDAAMTGRPLPFVIECVESLIEGLGITPQGAKEDLTSDRLNFLLKVTESDPCRIITKNFPGTKYMSYPAGLFLKVVSDLMSAQDRVSLGIFFARPENTDRITKMLQVNYVQTEAKDFSNPKIRENLTAWMESGKLPSTPVKSLRGMIPVYAEWLAQGKQPTEQS